jgi:cell division transport system permease protein
LSNVHDFIERYKPSRRLGIAQTRRYDLPLHNDSGSGFLRLLLGLMALLTVLALCATFALNAVQDRWESGLRGQFTVEVPADQKAKLDDVHSLLSAHPDVESAVIMQDSDIQSLLAPWLGENWKSSDIPIPGIISVALREGTAPNMEILGKRLNETAKGTRIDAHESWLADVLRFTGVLSFAAALLCAVVALTVIVAVIGGVRTRMEIHKEQLQLLHLMGASDLYIARQIMRHSFLLALQGALGGTCLAILIVLFSGWIAGDMGASLLPDFSLSGLHWATLLACPVILAIMAMGTARVTALRELRRMP